MTRKTGIVASGVLLSLLLACQPASLPGLPATGTGHPAVISLGAQPGATITISVAPQSPMRVQDLPKYPSDVKRYKVSLYDSGTNAIVMIGGVTPATIETASTQTQFVGVPAGDYYIKANAFSDLVLDTSIVEPTAPGVETIGAVNGWLTSINTVNVVNGVATYTNPTGLVPAPTSLIVNMPLMNGTVGTGSANVAVGNRTTALPTADRSGLSLLNLATRRAKANAVNPSTTYSLSAVQTGAKTGQTHELWFFAADSVNLLASVPRPFGTGANGAGTIGAALAPSHTVQTISTAVSAGVPVAITVTAGHNAVTDGSGNLYYFGGGNIHSRTVASNYGADSTVLTADDGALTGWVVTKMGAGFYSTGTNIRKATNPLASGGTLAVTANNVGPMAVDEGNSLYYIETGGSQKIKRAAWNGSSYLAPIDVVTAVTAPTMLAADAYGNVFYSSGTNIFKATLDTDEVTYLAPVQVATAAGITSLTVDSVGNIYFTDASNAVKFVPASEPTGSGTQTTYTIAGPGTGVGVDNVGGNYPTTKDLNTPNNVAVTTGGMLLFTSKGAGADRFLRYTAGG